MSTTELIILLFLIDIGLHIVFTVGIGFWLNREAKKAVTGAASEMYDALVNRVPEPLRQMFGITAADIPPEREEIPA